MVTTRTGGGGIEQAGRVQLENSVVSAPSTASWREVAREVLRKPGLTAGIVILAVLFLAAGLDPLIRPYDPLELTVGPRLAAPSWHNLLGTDNYGRDILSRLIDASRVSVVVSSMAVLIATGLGVPIGVVAGYLGGKTETVLMRGADAALAFPSLLFAILMAAFLGTGTVNLGVFIGLVSVATYARLAHGQTLAVKEMGYVEASVVAGATTPRILLTAIVPNILDSLLVAGSMTMGVALLLEASLSFLGLGVPAPAAAWGSMLKESQMYASEAPWYVLAPGLCITISILAFNLTGDGLRDLLDPRLRRLR